MNTSIKKVIETTDNENILAAAAKLMSWSNRRIRCSFLKKDGTIRNMVFSVVTNWNTLNGITTTKSGLEMLATKVARGMITVTEWLENGSFRPRTINLTKLISMEAL